MRLPVIALLSALALAGCLPRTDEVGPEHSSKQSGAEKSRTDSKAKKPTQAKAPGASSIRSPPKPKQDTEKDPPLGEGFVDDFARPVLGGDWRATGPYWRIEDGRVCGKAAHNHPLWLKRRLPENARIEFDAISHSPNGDIKVEAWGDGQSFASGASYDDATSYVLIFGGWKNQFHVLARQREHASDRQELKLTDGPDPRARRVKEGQSYRMKIERQDGTSVRWWVDDTEILSYNDKRPLKGRGHEHFGFNDWEVHVCFDNLRITPL